MNASEFQPEWNSMETAGGFRRLDTPQPLDWYIGLSKDSLPALMLISSAQPPALKPTKALGIAKRRRVGTDNRWTLVFDIKSKDFQPVFAEFCASLLNCTTDADSDQSAMRQVISNYRKWQALFRRGAPRRLSEAQRRALLAQLLYLKEMTDAGMPFEEAFTAWTGPRDDGQDFRMPEFWAVVEPHDVSETYIEISSLRRLDAEPPGLLVLVHLKPANPPERCVTLLGTVEELYGLAEEAGREDAFAERLAGAGYIPGEESGARAYTVSGFTEYEVSCDFPRLTPANVPKGIAAAAYHIEISAIANWEKKGSSYDF